MLSKERGMAAQLERATGKSLAQWIAVGKSVATSIAKTAAAAGAPPKEKACAERLHAEHGLGKMAAMWVAHYACTDDDPADYADPSRLVDALYSGPKAALRPLHEAVVGEVLALGDDVTVTACKTMVPAYRKHVFAELRPGDGGVDVQLALGEVPAKGRLRPAQGRAPGDRMTHSVLVRSERDVDAELRGLLAKAYEHGAKPMSRGRTDLETPPDVAKALRASKPAAATWAACTPAMRRDFVQWIVSAKQEETRTRRIAQAVAKLAEGKKRMY
jgi:hypothetical protein